MFSTEDLKTAIGATVIARRNAAARLREAGNPRDPFRALPGMEQQFFEAAQSVRSYDLVLNLLEREVKREARKRAGRTAQSAAAFLITAGLILLATLGFAAALLLMRCPVPAVSVTAFIGVAVSLGWAVIRENVNTPEQRKKLRDWFYKAVSKAGDTYTDIVYIGTLLHFDALLANVAKNPSYKSVRYQGVISFATNGELWDAWESIFTDLSNDNRQEDALEFFQANREAMLEGTAVLWEEKLSYYDLMVIRISEGEASFNSEIQNDPIDPENCTFQEEWFDFWDDEGKAQPDFSDPKFLFVGANDPSLGKNKKSDTSSIIALAKDTQTGYLYVVIADIAKRKPDQIIEDALDASRRLQREYKRPYYKFGVETVQFQYYFAEIMRQRAAAVGEYLPIEEINSTQNKDARIQSLQPFVKNGYIKFSKKHKTLLKQMTEYPMGKNDDAPDGLQMAVKLALDVKIGRRVDYRSVIARALDFRRGAY